MSNYRRYFIEGYNYVFITMVTYKRQKLLIDNIELLRKSFEFAKVKYPFDIYACVVLKDHLHCILKVENERDFPEIVRLIKYHFSRNIEIPTNKDLSESKRKKGEKGIWQRRYWEHLIRNEKDLYTHLDYIHYNPYKHYEIAPKNWAYSSFKKFVKIGYYDNDWLNFGDKNEIEGRNYE